MPTVTIRIEDLDVLKDCGAPAWIRDIVFFAPRSCRHMTNARDAVLLLVDNEYVIVHV